MNDSTLEGSLTFLGFVISILAVFYFAVTFLPQVSEWTQLIALLLLALAFAFAGVWVASTSIGGPFFGAPSLRWLRPAVVLYLMAIFSGIVAEIRFLSIDALAEEIKILVSLLIGVGMIVVVARRRREKDGPQEAPPPEG